MPAFAEIDDWLVGRLLAPDAILDAALAANASAGLPAIDVSAAQGRLLTILARIAGARRILEIGTLGGYSTICLARALPADGALVTLELEPRHAQVARSNLAQAGLAGHVEVRIGAAADLLAAMIAAGEPPFDLIFIDADKASYPTYLDRALALARPGSVLVCDNVVRGGRILDAGSEDPAVIGTRTMLARVGADPRLDGTAIQTVGAKGHDGFLIATVRASETVS